MEGEEFKPHPYKPGDWAWDEGSQSIGKVRRVYWDANEALFDLWIFDREGTKIGRESPALGGPKTYEPACSASGWVRIRKPEFPIKLKWFHSGGRSATAKFFAGNQLPPANYVPGSRPAKGLVGSLTNENRYVRALQKIRDGHNDPRSLASEVLIAAQKGQS